MNPHHARAVSILRAAFEEGEETGSVDWSAVEDAYEAIRAGDAEPEPEPGPEPVKVTS